MLTFVELVSEEPDLFLASGNLLSDFNLKSKVETFFDIYESFNPYNDEPKYKEEEYLEETLSPSQILISYQSCIEEISKLFDSTSNYL